MTLYAQIVVYVIPAIAVVVLASVAVGKIIERLDPYDQES